MSLKKNSTKGFTLIELLVVVGIIAFIASAILASFSSARLKARNSVRLQEVNVYSKAVELYQTSKNTYPDGGIDWTVAPAYRCLGRGASGATCYGGIYSGDATLDGQFFPYMTSVISGVDTGLSLGGYAYRCIPLPGGVAGDPCLQYTVLYEVEGMNALCAGGYVVDPVKDGTNTWCQIIQCGAGLKPVRGPGGGSPPYTCQ
jgi:prepilin-type N-terminal cleavage/methylation domain-containing protein